MRLFFALWPREDERDKLWAAIHAQRVRGRIVARENLHLTLRFLGQVTEQAYPEIVAAAGRVRAAPFTLILDTIGVWPKAGVQWFGSSDVPPALLKLAEDLDIALQSCGIEPEPRPFAAHLTIARKVRGRRPAEPLPRIELRVEDFVLVASNTDPAGARYRLLERWPLGH
jgi:2'-5' RNA ligase